MANTVAGTKIVEVFLEKFGHQPRLFRSPGRINLIGEHTDYNAGFVLPAGVDKAVYFAISQRDDEQVVLYAADLDEEYRFAKDNLEKPTEQWAWFQLGVLDQLKKLNLDYSGFQLVFGGDIPQGAGMSSSAALECCLLFALNELNGYGLSRMEIAKLGQNAENEYVGVNCGIMDQFASVFGKAGSVIRLDCRSLEYAYFPFSMESYSIVLCDTKVKHSLGDSEYNTRREECEAGVAILKKHYPEISHLRDVSPAQVEQHRGELPGKVFDRCKFISEEVVRVPAACDLLLERDLAAFGQKMYETHHGLQHLYEVSCPELDFLVQQTRSLGYVLGARMMGGGFGGCTINVVDNTYLDEFERVMKNAYYQRFGIELPVYRVRIENGSEEITL